MPSAREMRLRIRSVKNIGQVTRALEAVSASKVRKAVMANQATKPYAEKAWKVILHLARQPGRRGIHPLLTVRDVVRRILVVVITSDRGLAGASNINVMRMMYEYFANNTAPIDFVTIGKKGRDLLIRGRQYIEADFSPMASPASYRDVSPVGNLVVNDFEIEKYDQVFLAYNQFENMMIHKPVIRRILPVELDLDGNGGNSFDRTHPTKSVFIYEPEQEELLNEIVPRFTSMQILQAVLSAQASEHAARMIAMRNATDNATELASTLQLEYNKARQQTITNDLLDIAGGVIALE